MNLNNPFKSLVPVGTVINYVGLINTKPESNTYGILPEQSGWVVCDGRKLKKAEYPELFAVLRYTYGGNNNDDYFNIPDLSNSESPFPKGVTVHFLMKFTY